MTCDNASNNDTMVRKLSIKVPVFRGSATHTWCFLHTVNLVAKSLIREFDIKKKNANRALADSREYDDEVGAELRELSEEVDGEEVDDEAANGSAADDDVDRWIDEVELLGQHERLALEKDIRPVKLVLVKVSEKK